MADTLIAMYGENRVRWTRWDHKIHEKQNTPAVLANKGGADRALYERQPSLEKHTCWVTRHPQKAGKNAASADWSNSTWPHPDRLTGEALPFPPVPGKLASLVERSNQAGFSAEEWGFTATRPQFREKMTLRKEGVSEDELQALSRYRAHTPKGWRFFGPEHAAAGKALSIHRWRRQWPCNLPSTCGRTSHCAQCKWLITHITTLPSLDLCARSAADIWVGET